MAQGIVDTVVLATDVAPKLSMISLFIQADIVVKIVMIMLVIASIWCWAIIIDKVIKIRRAQAATDLFEQRFWSGRPLMELFRKIDDDPSDPMSVVFVSGMQEWSSSIEGDDDEAQGKKRVGLNLHQRIERVMDIAAVREIEALEKMMPFLASVGSSAPFIGLFGTVWGIMNSFTAIAATKQTSLAVVAPGIAEALFATALGLVAAVPATIGYNKLSTDINRYAARLESFVGEFSTIVSRELDR